MSEFQHHTDNSFNEHPYAIKWPDRLVGRVHEIGIIERALHDWAFEKRILYFTGEGGVGKSRLLRETAQRARRMPKLLSTEVIDLYHFRHHQPMTLMLTIARQLRDSIEQQGESRPTFENFRRAINKYLAKSGDIALDSVAYNGGSVAIEVEVRKALTQEFVKDYKKLSAEFGIVLLIDTFEKLHPIIEGTKNFNFREASRFEDWIVTDLIPRLPNTLTLIAGRKNEQQTKLLKAPRGVTVTPIDVQPLSKDETIEFIRESLEGYACEDQENVIEQLYSYSHGKPVVLSLALAYLQVYGDGYGLPLLADDEVNEATLISNIIQMLQMKDQQLADSLQRAFLLRKGLNVELLMQLNHEDNEDEVSKRIDFHARYPFFKRTGQRKKEAMVVVLHDELYDRFHGRLPEGNKRNAYNLVISYIEGLINKRLKELKQGESSEQNWIPAELEDVDAEAGSHSMRWQAAQQIRLMRVEQLFYELARNPKRGYQQYRRLANAAIQAHDEDFDMLLQDELARFFELTPGVEHSWGQKYREELEIQGISWDQVVFEEGVRWAERRLNAYKQGEDRYAEALKIANMVQEAYPHIYEQSELARYALDAARLRARMYQSRETTDGRKISDSFWEVAEPLATLIQQLEAENLPGDHFDGSPHEDDLAIQDSEIRYAKLILAALYNDFGYYERMQERYESAADKYTRSIRLYKEVGPEANGLRAVVLTNLAFARHQQGLSKRGLGLVRAALDLATKYGSPHQVATTLNMLARIELRYNRVSEKQAYATVKRARRLFDTLKSGRGSALCALNEGNVLCALAATYIKQADHSAHHLQQARQHYKRAIERYEYAMAKFDEQPQTEYQQPQSELLRRIEARVGLGAVYRERGLLQRQEQVTLDGIDPDADLQQALDLAQKAWRLCNDETPAVTRMAILEDMAFVAIEQGKFDLAREKIRLARDYIPGDYTIREGIGIRYTPAMEDEAIYWFRLSQLELQDALIAFRQDQAEAGCQHLLRSFACLHTFSPYAPLKRTIRELGKRELRQAVERSCTAEDRSFHQQISELRRATSNAAATLHIPRPSIVELDELFDDLEGLIDDDEQPA